MKRLVLANTYFQLITAIQLNMTIFINDDVDLIITNETNGAYEIYEAIKAQAIFKNVTYVETKNNMGRSFTKKIYDLFCIVFKKNNFYSFILKSLSNRFYDEIILYNSGPYIWGIYSVLSSINPKISLSMYEEGIISYSSTPFANNSKFDRTVFIFRNFFRKPVFYGDNHVVYCFLPELYNGPYNAIRIEKINNQETIEMLKNIFGLHEKLDIKEKYIYFSSVLDFEGGEPIGELQLIEKVSNIVGKDNIIVKVHPRDSIQRFKEHGLKVFEYSNVPWEVLQLSLLDEEKVYLTTNSGSLLSNYIYDVDSKEAMYLYWLCNFDKNWNMKDTMKYLESLFSKFPDSFNYIHVIRDFEEIERVCL